MIKKTLYVNGVRKTLIVSPDKSLAEVLREQLDLTGTKIGCGQGQCGCCSVILDGKLVRSCVTKMKRVPDEACVTTVEGIGDPGQPAPAAAGLVVHGGAQCGFCTPGFIVSAKALLDENPNPTRAGGARLVPEAPQRLPLHRLQAPGRRGHGRGQGDRGARCPARALEFRCRPTDGSGARKYPAALGRGQGDRHHRLRRRPGSEDARRHAAVGPGAGQGLARQHPRPSTPPKPRRCPASSRWSPTRTSRARTASPA